MRQSLPLGLLALFAVLAVLGTTVTEPLVSTIAANIAMVAVAFWLIRFGLTEDRSRPFGAGVVYLLLWAVLRYIDPVRRLRRDARRVSDVFPLRRSAHGRGTLLAKAEGGVPWLTTPNCNHLLPNSSPVRR